MSPLTPSISSREQTILRHMPQVRLLATRAHRRCPLHVELDDVISAGTIGLIQAVDRFDVGRGLKLKTLAEHRIRGAILDYLRLLDPLPRRLRTFVRQRAQIHLELEHRLGRPPEAAELAQALGLPLDQFRVLEVRARTAHFMSLSEVQDRVASEGV